MNVTEQLQALVRDEPPYPLDVESVVRGGRRRRHIRTTATAATGVIGVVALVGGVLALLSGGPEAKPVTLLPAASTRAAPVGQIEGIVRARTPSGWTLSEVHESAGDFQADVDDGAGAGRLTVGVSPSPGSLQQHPCDDAEFVQQGECREVQLDGQTRLITRSPASSGPVNSAYVVIVHRDGSGVYVGNDNGTWPWIEAGTGPVTPEQKRAMTRVKINRPAPAYSTSQLVEIAKAVDAATSTR